MATADADGVGIHSRWIGFEDGFLSVKTSHLKKSDPVPPFTEIVCSNAALACLCGIAFGVAAIGLRTLNCFRDPDLSFNSLPASQFGESRSFMAVTFENVGGLAVGLC